MRRWGLLGSFGTVGDCFDNAAMESFWARLQVELLNTRKWATTIELAAAMADYIDNFYNIERRHSYLGNISPTEFENALDINQLDPSTRMIVARNSGDRSTGPPNGSPSRALKPGRRRAHPVISADPHSAPNSITVSIND